MYEYKIHIFENAYARSSFKLMLEASACNFIKKDILVHMLSFFKGIYLIEHIQTTAFEWKAMDFWFDR